LRPRATFKDCNGDFSHLGGDLESGARTQGIAGHLALKTAGLMAAATADDPLLKRFSQKRLEEIGRAGGEKKNR